jgi:hypothetical protein
VTPTNTPTNTVTPTTTPTNTVTQTPTNTPTSTLGLTNYLAQQCCPTTQYWTLPNGNITDFSTAIPFVDCEDAGVCYRSIRDGAITRYCNSGITLSVGWTYETQPCGAKAIKSLGPVCSDTLPTAA